MSNTEKDLVGISYVCFFVKGRKHINIIDMSDTSTTENTGNLWCKDAYGNALICLKHQKSIDALYLMSKYSMSKFKPFVDRKEQIEYLKSNATRIITR